MSTLAEQVAAFKPGDKVKVRDGFGVTRKGKVRDSYGTLTLGTLAIRYSNGRPGTLLAEIVKVYAPKRKPGIYEVECYGGSYWTRWDGKRWIDVLNSDQDRVHVLSGPYVLDES